MYARNLSSELDAEIIPAETPLRQIRETVSEKRLDVVDIQFEYRTFGSHLRTLASLPILCVLLSPLAGTVVTVHGVLTLQSLRGQKFRFAKLIAYIISLRACNLFCDHMIVHSEPMKRELGRYGLNRVTVVPHGSGPLDYKSQTQSSSVLFFGFIRPSKGIDRLIVAFKRVLQVHPDASLVVAGGPSGRGEANFLDDLLALVKDLELGNKVKFLTEFVPESTKRSLAAGSAMLVLPYVDDFLEVSGVVHDFSGYGVCLVCSPTPRFSELRDGVDCLKIEVGASELADAICRLLDNVALRETLASNLYELAKSETWAKVAQARITIYDAVIRSKEPAARDSEH